MDPYGSYGRCPGCPTFLSSAGFQWFPTCSNQWYGRNYQEIIENPVRASQPRPTLKKFFRPPGWKSYGASGLVVFQWNVNGIWWVMFNIGASMGFNDIYIYILYMYIYIYAYIYLFIIYIYIYIITAVTINKQSDFGVCLSMGHPNRFMIFMF